MSELSIARPTLRVEAVTDSVLARPGTVVPCTVRVHNDGAQPLRFTVRVVGLGEPVEAQQVPWEPLAPGGVLDIEVPVIVPEAMAPGDHSVAIEVTVDGGRTSAAGGAPVSTPGRRPMKPTIALAPMIVKVGSLDQVLLRTKPSVVRGRFGSRFELEVINKRHDAVTVDIAADAPDLDVEFEPSTVLVPSGETAFVAAKVRGSHHWFGGDRQHIVNIEGSGSAVPSYTRVVFRERPILARGLTGVVAAIVLLSLWAGILGGAAFWLLKSDGKATPEATAADLNGDGLPDKPGTGTGTGTDGGTGTGTDGEGGDGGAPGSAPGTDPEAASAPTSTVLRGKVKAGDTGNDGDVVVTLTPLVSSLDDPDASSSASSTTVAAGFLGRTQGAGSSGSLFAAALGIGGEIAANVGLIDDGQIATGGKFWSARYGTYTGSRLADGRATISVIAGSSPDGTWTIDDVPLRRSYEVSFSKPGFDRQSFLVTPTDDGKPVELDVELVPGQGALGGVINGPAGRLGGVELTVTDGTLTFSATTSTDPASLGEWIIEGLSTPATYTITAVLDGYGTAVAQVALGVGESSTNLAFTMSNGVGSIGGTVTGADGPLGGITLTASGNGVTRTTTSLTAGATGTYLFPDMEIPGVYTLTAAAPGYITQTRLVSLTANATGIDMNLVRTTARVIGVVTSITAGSAGPGLPLPNASAEITLDTLSVRTTTAVAPDTGSFDLADLPPGTYTISFGRYDHLSDSRLITLTAGQVLDLGDVPLVYSPRPQLDPTGSISVSVSDVDGPLDEATITITDVAGRLPALSRTLATGETSFKFEQVPIGSYRIVISRDSYRPLTVPRVAVGLSDRVVTASLLKFGQAFGQVIDGVAPQVTVADKLTAGRPLDDYRMLVYEVLSPGVYACRGTVESSPGEPLDGEGRINWEVGLNLQLLSGTYVLRFSRAPGDNDPRCSGAQVPRGYAARPDGSGNVASFTILPDNDDPVKVDDVSVFPYPHIAGLVFAPVWNNGTVELAEATTLANGLAVRLRCGSLVGNATLSVASGVVTFDLSRQTVGTMFNHADVPGGGVLASCRIEATAPGFASVDRAIPTALTIPTGTLYDDRVLSIVLADDPDDLVGTTTWVDHGPGGTVHVISGAKISATDVIVSFDVTEAVDNNAEEGPGIVPGPDDGLLADLLTTSAAGSGIWSFTVPGQQQLAGESTYDITADQFADASFTLVIDGTGRLLSSQAGLESPVVDDGTLDLQLAPTPGSLSGSVAVVSSVANPPIDEAVIHATPPGGTGTDVTVDGSGNYTIDPAAAGTWQVDFRADPDSNLVPAPGQTATTEFVDAGATATLDQATYWDLGQVSVEFRDPAGAAVPDAIVDVAQDPVAGSYPTWLDRSHLNDPSGDLAIRRLSVDPTDPTLTPVSYRLTVSAAGYDLSTATYEVLDADGNQLATGGDPTSITVSVVAGSRLSVRITLPANGSIAGTVLGLLRPPSTADVDVEALDLDDELTVTVVQTANGRGEPVTPTTYPVTRVAPTNTTPVGFTVDVPPGEYDVTYAHPDFMSTTVHYVVGDGQDVDGSANLDIARGSFELAVVTDNVSQNPVGGATVKLFPSGTRIGNIALAVPAYQGVTGTDGRIDFDPAYTDPLADGTGVGIIPGDYLLVVRKADPLDNTRDDHFPVIATIHVPRGGDAAARTLSRRAVMPRTDGSIVGTVTARNLDGDPLPVPDPVTISRSYEVPQAGGTDGVDNDATEDNLSPVPAAERTVHPATVGALSSSYGFEALGAGLHTLTFSDAAGYATPAAVDVVVDGQTAATLDPIEYVADNVDWNVTIVNTANQPVSGLTLRALGPNGDLLDADEDGTTGVYRFTDVAPQIGAYVLQLNSGFYQAVTPANLSVTVRPRATALATTLSVRAVAVIEGVANKLGSGGSTTPLTDADAITLRTSPGGTVLQTTTADANGNYRFELTTAGTYLVRASVSGHTVETVTVTGVALGTIKTAPVLAVEQFATAAITVTGTPDGTATVTVTPNTGVSVAEDPSVDGLFNVTGLDPGSTYVFNASAPARIGGRAPASGSHNPDIGGTYTATIELEELRTFTGSVANDVDGATVVLFKNSVQFATTTTASGGNYSFTGLDYGSYTISVSKGGVGAGSTATAIVVQAASVVSVTVPEITLVPRSLDITFTITANAGTPVPTITLDGNTNAAGDLTFTVSEDTPLDYSIDAPGYLRVTGTLSVSPTASTPLKLNPSVALTRNAVTGALTGTGNNGSISVRLCASTATSPCNNPVRTLNAPATSYTFNGIAPGTYKVFAIKGQVTVSTTVVVNDDGTVEPIATLDLTPPPPVVP